MATKQTETPVRVKAVPLDAHLVKRQTTLEAFAKDYGVPFVDLSQHGSNVLFLVDGKLFYRATRSNTKFAPTLRSTGTLLSDQIKRQPSSEPDPANKFAKDHGESKAFIHSAIRDGGIVLQGEILLPLSVLPSWPAVLLERHIEDTCKGNNTGFSRAYGKHQQQIDRWISKHCFFCRGDVYLRRTSYTDMQTPPVQTHAVLLEDHIRTQYGEGDSGVLLFKEQYGIKAQQVRRYLDYGALWICGEVYKNQSHFIEEGVTPDMKKAARPKTPRTRKRKK